MERYANVETISRKIGIESKIMNEVINDYLGVHGSTIVKDKEVTPEVMVLVDNGFKFGVTALEINGEEEEYRYYYWLD